MSTSDLPPEDDDEDAAPPDFGSEDAGADALPGHSDVDPPGKHLGD